MSFPAELSNAIDGVTEVVAAHLNNLEAKVGTDNSTVVTSLDYLLKNAGSIDPGHKHTAGALSGGNDGEVFYKAAGAWGPGTPEAAGLVAKSGDQSIAGVKTFTSIPMGPASNPTTDNQLARKAYVDLMLPLAGGAMAGNIAMNSHKVTGLAAASGTGEAMRYDEWIAAQDPGHKQSKLWASNGSPEAVTVNSSGWVGIEKASPQCLLHVGNQTKTDLTGSTTFFVGNTGTANNAALMELKSGAGSVMIVTNAGNLGINTTSPEYAIDLVKSADHAKLRAKTTAAAGQAAIILDRPSDVRAAYVQMQTDGTDAWVMGTGLYNGGASSPKWGVSSDTNLANAKLIIDTSGNVGIGTTSPGKKLEVNGYVRGYGIFNTLNSAPADGDLAAGECALWFDKTDGAAKLMIKAKQNDGTVKTASIALS